MNHSTLLFENEPTIAVYLAPTVLNDIHWRKEGGQVQEMDQLKYKYSVTQKVETKVCL